MGYYKNLLIDSYDDEEGNAIANALGISYFDLRRTSYQIEENRSDSGVLHNYTLVFSDSTPKDVLKKIEGLKGNSINIDRDVLLGDYGPDYEYEFEAINNSSKLSDNFTTEIESLKKLNEINLSETELTVILKRQIYIAVIGSMETFLSETFIKLVLTHQPNLERFVKSYPEFASRRFALRDVFDTYKNIEETAKSVMLDTIYHDLRKVREMYRSTFEISFPSIEDAIKCVMVRHDLVHRNGKSKEGEVVQLDSTVIEKTIDTVAALVHNIIREIEKEDFDKEAVLDQY